MRIEVIRRPPPPTPPALVTVTIGGVSHELSDEEACNLWSELNRLYGQATYATNIPQIQVREFTCHTHPPLVAPVDSEEFSTRIMGEMTTGETK